MLPSSIIEQVINCVLLLSAWVMKMFKVLGNWGKTQDIVDQVEMYSL